MTTATTTPQQTTPMNLAVALARTTWARIVVTQAARAQQEKKASDAR